MAFNQGTYKVDMMTQYLQQILHVSFLSLLGLRAARKPNFSKVREKWLPIKKIMNDKAIL